MNIFNKRIKRTIALFLVLAAILSTHAFALSPEDFEFSPTASGQINGHTANISISPDGKVNVSFTIIASGEMLDIGVTDIYIYQNDSNGNHSTAASIHHTDPEYSYIMRHNADKHNSSVSINATTGYEYHAYVFFKARNSSGTDTRTVHTSYVVA